MVCDRETGEISNRVALEGITFAVYVVSYYGDIGHCSYCECAIMTPSM